MSDRGFDPKAWQYSIQLNVFQSPLNFVVKIVTFGILRVKATDVDKNPEASPLPLVVHITPPIAYSTIVTELCSVCM